MTYFKKLIPLLLSGIAFIVVIWQLEPPVSLAQASLKQVVLFFIPLTAFLYSLFYFILKKTVFCFLITVYLLTILSLKSLDILSWITILIASLISLAGFLLIKKNTQPKRPRPKPQAQPSIKKIKL